MGGITKMGNGIGKESGSKTRDKTREEWLNALLRIVDPVMESLGRGELRKQMPLDFHEDRKEYAPLEAFGRSMMGLAPWLEAEGVCGEEKGLQEKYRKLAVLCMDRAADPDSPDYMGFARGGQNLVDTAFLSHALVRAPRHLAEALPDATRNNLIRALKCTRDFIPGESNWILFSAMVEAGLYVLGEAEFDKMRIVYALRTFDDWYKGDGVYGDGAIFHWDYYNSFVIQPMYVDLMDLFGDMSDEFRMLKPKVLKRAVRYAAILERMIAPDGTWPILGRSICYRFGAFQMLAQAALEHRLPDSLHPAQVRCALTAVLEKVMQAPDMFDQNGWLQPGVYGCQPELAEGYINTGSLYLCTALFLPLGLPADDEFWSGEEEAWSSLKVWSGGQICRDHAID